ncbi:dipeptide ABC transporter ATP-binding protein [Gulosibacter chungangensis]|uniref:ABC transporter ATP-binding protein n=1 Tax=Gulosibacter chungangensis TaxID=979746 RepID=A0A7J5BDI8_9MICO|nr:ABC transporter ATP-binding protein [Gulosibacter chungangensis]KAB1643649.1 ABC transporter ATP-binding protein [Gulosibacter chungangensis]
MNESNVSPLLRVESLTVSYDSKPVVRDVSFSLDHGQSLAVIGESGSGKSTTARAILRLLGNNAAAAGCIELGGQDILKLPEGKFRQLRGRSIGFVPQDPAHALNPVRTVGAQAAEAAALLDGLDREAQRKEILAVFTRVGLPDPERVLTAYPHELSGGMLQRVLIGLAILPRPKLLIADEPTSALDVTIQKQILDLLDELRRDLDIGLVLITHDLAIAAKRSDQIVVLKDGAVQEAGRTAEIFAAPRSEYTKRLQCDVPALNPERYAEYRRERQPAAGPSKLEFQGVTKRFGALTAVDAVSFSIAPGTTHAIVGESGSGKTTAIRLLLGLERADAGQIHIDGENVLDSSRKAWRSIHRQLQLVYQNPFTSLDPTWNVERLIREPLDRFKVGPRAERTERVHEAVHAVGLPLAALSRRPSALSGGQRQRVAIARAIVLRPEVIVLDEPTSALDVSVQAEIFDVLFDLQAKHGLTYLLVSHDLALVRQVADTVSVMRKGQLIESGAAEHILHTPKHEYTRALVDAIPVPPEHTHEPTPSHAVTIDPITIGTSS